MKTFMELRNAHPLILAYDGNQSHTTDVLLPETAHNDPNDSYFVHSAKGKL